jgi:hypothetical protein
MIDAYIAEHGSAQSPEDRSEVIGFSDDVVSSIRGPYENTRKRNTTRKRKAKDDDEDEEEEEDEEQEETGQEEQGSEQEQDGETEGERGGVPEKVASSSRVPPKKKARAISAAPEDRVMK